MYRAVCQCGGYVDFKRSHLCNHHYCGKCGELLVVTMNGLIEVYNSARVKGYFKVGAIHDSTHQ
jgi:hypothetical protein